MKYLLIILLLVSQAQAARKFTSGGEKGGNTWAAGGAPDPEGFLAQQYGGYESNTAIRTGNGSLSFLANGTPIAEGVTFTAASVTPPVYLRFWIWTTGTPNTNSRIVGIYDATNTNGLWLEWKASGKMALSIGASAKDSTPSAVAGGQWVLCKFYSSWKGSNDTNRIIIGSDTLTNFTSMGSSPINIALAWQVLQLNPGKRFTIDDFAWNDAAGSYENGAPDDSGRVYALYPVSDDSLGNWTNGAGTTTSLYQAVYNAPPGGKDTTIEDQSSQIRHNNASSSSYKAEIQAVSNYVDINSFTISSAKTIRVATSFVRTGEHRSLGTKTGILTLVSNPNDASPTTFTIGNDSSHGKEVINFNDPAWVNPKRWKTAFGTTLYFPTINRSQTTAIRLTYLSSTGDVIVDADQLGMEIEVGSSNGAPTVTRVYQDDD